MRPIEYPEAASGRMQPRRLSTIVLLFTMSVGHAHHSRAMFDRTMDIEFQGIVTRVEWSNPHVYIHVVANAETPDAKEWLVEAHSTSMMVRQGWSETSLRIGDAVLVRAHPARNPSSDLILGDSIRASDGTTLHIASQPDVEEPAAIPGAAGIAGIWLGGSADDRLPEFTDPSAWQLTPAGLQALSGFDEMEHDSPLADCISITAPFVMTVPDIKRVEVLQDSVVFSQEWFGVTRIVHMDTRAHPPASESWVQGHSVGWWDGETLVVDTANFADHSWGNAVGVPSGPGKHLLERFTLGTERDSLILEFVLEDADYLSRAVTGTYVWQHRPDLEPTIQSCDPEIARRYLDAI